MKILFASDVSFNYFKRFPGINAAKNAFADVSDYFKNADFSIINLENIFGVREEETPIAKGGPNLISTYEFVNYIDELSPKAIGLANNHCRDFGKEPMLKTKAFLKEKGYQVIGAGENLEDAYLPAVFEKDGLQVEIFAVCENEYGFATEDLAGSAGYRLSLVRDAIKESREKGSLPIIYFHGGNERNPYPSPGKVEMYRNFVEMGAAAVIAMHTHCPQGIEVYKNAPIVYSMGNFFFPFEGCKEFGIKTWGLGYMTELDIDEKGAAFNVIPYEFDFDLVRVLKDKKRDEALAYIARLSEPISNEKRVRELFDSWCMISGLGVVDQPRHINHVTDFEPEHLEAFVKEKIKNEKTSPFINVKNIFSCEAHNELLRNTFDMVYDGRCEAAMAGVEEILKLQRLEI